MTGVKQLVFTGWNVSWFVDCKCVWV